MVSSVYREYDKLIVRVRRYMGIFHLIELVLDIVQVLLDVQDRQKFGSLLFVYLSIYFLLGLI